MSRKTLPKPKILQVGLPGQDDRGARFLTVDMGDMEFSSVYALYGNPRKYGIEGAIERKIAWMRRLREHVGKQPTLSGRCMLAGDFNVVSDGNAIPRTLNHTEGEREELSTLLDVGFVDLYRHRHPHIRTGCNYGFNPHEPVASRLRRILGTEAVADHLHEAWVDLEYRKNSRAQSAPVIVDLSGEA